jgi:hypothetical protein
VRMAASSQSSVPRAALGIVLRGNARPMVDSVTQSDVRRVAHDDDVRLAASFGHWRDTRQCAQRLIVAAAERPRCLGEQCREIDPADSRQGLQNCHVALRNTVLGCGPGLANESAELVEFTLYTRQLPIDDMQTNDQRV